MVAAVTSPTPDEGRNRVRLDAAYEQFPLMAELALAVIDDVAERRHLDITLARGAFFEVLYTGFASILICIRYSQRLRLRWISTIKSAWSRF